MASGAVVVVVVVVVVDACPDGTVVVVLVVVLVDVRPVTTLVVVVVVIVVIVASSRVSGIEEAADAAATSRPSGCLSAASPKSFLLFVTSLPWPPTTSGFAAGSGVKMGVPCAK